MVNELLLFAESNNIAIKERKIMLAVSGGIDSVVLAHLFSHLGIDFGIAHCNFKLRGKESDKDEIFVKKLAKSFNTPFHTKAFNTEIFARSKSISIQTAARDLRYEWFENIRKKHNYDLISTAHNQGDIAETILLNLSKGTGLKGLHGINVIHNKLLRPFLFASKNKIKAYAKKNLIVWREDSSNIETKYNRNKIRNNVIPILEEINPKAQNSIYITSKKIKATELFLKYTLKKITNKIIRKDNNYTHINIESLLKIEGFSYVLHEILNPFGFSYSQTNLISSRLQGIPGKIFYSSSHILNIDRTHLIVSPILQKKEVKMIKENIDEYSFGDLHILTKSLLRKEYTIKTSKKIIAVDKEKLHFPLEVRNWNIGDFFYPLGMQGKKKLSDFMIDSKIPIVMKQRILVVVSEENIVAILGYQLDDRFKITKKTKKVFEITCNLFS